MGSSIAANLTIQPPPFQLPSATTLRELIRFVRRNSSFYQELYRDVPDDAHALEQLPPVDHSSFWTCNSNNIDVNGVLTGIPLDGGIYRTGGTTSDPKVTFYSRDELHTITRQLADCTCRAGLRPGDRVANLYTNGDLYMSYLISILAHPDSNTPYVQLPISLLDNTETMVRPLKTYKVTVLMGMMTTLMRIAHYLAEHGEQLPDVHLLIYSGEALYADQKPLLARSFPGAIVRPMMYGSVDGGLMAIPLHDDELTSLAGGPVYIPNTPLTIIEILDEDKIPITVAGQRGVVHVTGTTRRLMPTIRYPTGDTAEWVDYARRYFVLRGRDTVGLKIGSSSYKYAHLREIVVNVVGAEKLDGFQAVARRRGGKDELVLRIASNGVQDIEGKYRELEDTLKREKSEYVRGTPDINPLAVEWVSMKDLYRSHRSGKLREIVEQRF